MFKENRLVYEQPGAGGEVPHASELEEGVKAPETGEKQEEGEQGIGRDKAEEMVKRTETMMGGMLQGTLEEVRDLKDPQASQEFNAMLTELNAAIVKATGYSLLEVSYQEGGDKVDIKPLPEAQLQELAKKAPADVEKMQASLATAYGLLSNFNNKLSVIRGKLIEAETDRLLAQQK